MAKQNIKWASETVLVGRVDGYAKAAILLEPGDLVMGKIAKDYVILIDWDGRATLARAKERAQKITEDRKSPYA